MSTIISLFLHLDVHLAGLIATTGLWTYALLFAILFCETGLIVTPFLPGDSLLFAAGALVTTTELKLLPLMILLTIAAIFGDTVNYWVGRHIGPKIFYKESGFFFHRDHLLRAQGFYEKHGGKAVILARFLPIFRTFAPFVAGVGKMSYGRFVTFNIVGGVIWVNGFLLLGYFFGNLPIIKERFSLVILAIVFVSFLPPIIRIIRNQIDKKGKNPTQ